MGFFFYNETFRRLLFCLIVKFAFQIWCLRKLKFINEEAVTPFGANAKGPIKTCYAEFYWSIALQRCVAG